MIIRFRGKDGMYRVTVADSDTFSDAVRQLSIQLPPHTVLKVASQANAAGEAENERWHSTLAELGVRHGDMFFVSYEKAQTSNTEGGGPSNAGAEQSEDPVDIELSRQDGKIPRQRSRLCNHGIKGMCEYCQPLEPFDEEYRLENNIKHLSFHAYLRKMRNESSLANALSEPDYTVNKNCSSGHAPWPASICSKCQPAAISLQLQRFRMVDHLEFANAEIMDRFIDYWRQTNTQRFGFLIGAYSTHTQVPLGIKAVVHAIYEPSQSDELDGIVFEADEIEVGARKAANALGLQIVGIIFTDLVDSGKKDGSVVCKRHAKSYFLSSLEAVLAARFQNRFPSRTRQSDSGYFSSKFVTCVVSGNELGEIDMACYQVSTQMQAMIRADLVVPSTNPSVLRIKGATKTRYIPDIFYKHTNEYKITVQENALPAFPVDYALVSVSHGFRDVPDQSVRNEFPIENRPSLRTQSVSQLVTKLNLNNGIDAIALLDYHLLYFLFKLEVLNAEEEKLLVDLLRAQYEDIGSPVSHELAARFAASSGVATLQMLSQ